MIKEVIYTVLLIVGGWVFAKIYQIYRIYKLILKINKMHIPYKEPDLQKRISSKEIPQNIDYIIIGSGMSGLMSAAILSKLNKRVVVLEQHDKPGGCLHSFEKEGYEFETGFHYVGNDSMLQGLLSMGSSKPIEFATQMESDMILFNDDNKGFLIEGPLNKYLMRLKAEFPQHEKQLEQFFALFPSCQMVSGLFMLKCFLLPKLLHPFVDLIAKLCLKSVYPKSIMAKFKELGFDKSPRLVQILLGQIGAFGIPQEEYPCHMAFMINYFVQNGVCYPKEGTKDIVKSLVSTIEHFSGKVFIKTRVEDILIQKGKAVGVKLRGGLELRARNVVSTIGLHQTLDALPEKLRWHVNYKSHKETIGCCDLFLGINTKDLELPRYNLIKIPCGENYDALEYQKKFLQTKDLRYSPYWIYFGNKDGKKRDKTFCVINCQYLTEWVIDYRKSEVERKPGYQEFKAKIQEFLLQKFLQHFPQCKDRIEYQCLSTPLTYETYLNRFGYYGMESNERRLLDPEVTYKFDTPVKGLYIAGEDTVGAGVMPAAASALFAVLKTLKLM